MEQVSQVCTSVARFLGYQRDKIVENALLEVNTVVLNDFLLHMAYISQILIGSECQIIGI